MSKIGKKSISPISVDPGGSDASSPSELQKLLDEKMKVYNNLAATQMKLLAYDQAIKSCDAVIKLQPNNVKAVFRKGQALESKGNSAEALTYFKVRTMDGNVITIRVRCVSM